MAQLIVLLKGREISRIPIAKAVTTIGRDSTCDVVIDNVGVSRLHATVRVEKGKCHLFDNGSSNGTLINGIRAVARHTLSDEDEITVGKFLIRFDASSGAPLPPEQEALFDLDDNTNPGNVVGTMMLSPEQAARAYADNLRAIRAKTASEDTIPPEERKSPMLLIVGVVVVLAIAFAAGWAFAHW